MFTHPKVPPQRTDLDIDINVTLTINYTEDLDGEGVILDREHLSTPDEFKDHYSAICDEKRKYIDTCKADFPKANYVISIKGDIRGTPISSAYNNLNQYHGFLVQHALIPHHAPGIKK